MNTKRWTLGFLALTMVLLAIPALATAWVDPFFHYGPPKESLQYPLDNPRYQNYGIVRHFPYNALISGSSMTENFKTSELDALFDTQSIKVPMSGATFREIHDLSAAALKANPDIGLVLWALDGNRLRDRWDALAYEESTYPWYLYDENPFNDTNYLLNKQVLFENTLTAVSYARSGRKTTHFDDYCNWMVNKVFGKEAILRQYQRAPVSAPNILTDAEIACLQENITRNIVDLASAHPETDFYLFFPPYSAYWWDGICRQGYLDHYVTLFAEASRLMLECDNIHLFAFFDVYDLICDPSNYKDHTHYHEDVNSQLLQWMAAGEHQLTQDNYADYWAAVKTFYASYDYDVLYS